MKLNFIKSIKHKNFQYFHIFISIYLTLIFCYFFFFKPLYIIMVLNWAFDSKSIPGLARWIINNFQLFTPIKLFHITFNVFVFLLRSFHLDFSICGNWPYPKIIASTLTRSLTPKPRQRRVSKPASPLWTPSTRSGNLWCL